jgi:putative transcriptional regulator
MYYTRVAGSSGSPFYILYKPFTNRENNCTMKNSLKVERAKKNITQAELSEAIGVSRQTINAIELGKYNPSVILALKLAKYFNTSIHQIFELDEGD